MYLYIVEIIDAEEESNFFGPFRSKRNAEDWGKEESLTQPVFSYKVIPLLDPHYINDAD